MIREGLEYLVELARGSNKLEILSIPSKKQYAVANNQTGQLTFFDIEPESRNHKIGSLDTVISEAKRLQVAPMDPVVWCSSGCIVILDDSRRRDRSVLAFAKTSQFRLLEQLRAKQCSMIQKAFVKMLRIDLDGCLGAAGNFLSLIRQLKFNAAQDGNASIQHGKESISRSTLAEVVGYEAIPEEILITVPVFDLVGEAHRPVRCAVDIDVTTSTLALIPFPGQLEAAENASIASMIEYLDAELANAKIPVVFGSPV